MSWLIIGVSAGALMLFIWGVIHWGGEDLMDVVVDLLTLIGGSDENS